MMIKKNKNIIREKYNVGRERNTISERRDKMTMVYRWQKQMKTKYFTRNLYISVVIATDVKCFVFTFIALQTETKTCPFLIIFMSNWCKNVANIF